MNPLVVVVFIVGLLVGFVPMYSWHSWQNDRRAKEIADAELVQEKKNVAIVTQYQDLLNNVNAWYSANPVRVRIPGTKECPGGITTDAESVVFTVGRAKRSDGTAVGP